MAEKTYKTYEALDIAKYVISKCTAENSPISNLQLQKILYFIQKDFLVNFNRPLFQDEIEAWPFGPVVSTVYYNYCGFGSMSISKKYEISIDNTDQIIVDRIVLEKRVKNPWDLVEETHAPGRAWALIYREGAGNRKVISKDLISTKG